MFATMQEPLQQLRLSLQKHKQSLTQSRQTVFKALLSPEPMTMTELIQACTPSVNRASVYRTVGLFEQLGIINRIQVGWKYRLELSDQFQHHHHHLHCYRCGMTLPLAEDAALESRLHQLALQSGFLPESHQLEITGICANCR